MGFRKRDPGRSRAPMKGAWAWALVIPPAAMALLFFVGPLLYLFWVSLHSASPSELYGPAVTVQNYVGILTDPFYITIIRRTLGVAATVLGVSLLVGYPVAYFVALQPPRRRMIVLLMLLFPLMVSNVVRA